MILQMEKNIAADDNAVIIRTRMLDDYNRPDQYYHRICVV